jgi:hypothetical protein
VKHDRKCRDSRDSKSGGLPGGLSVQSFIEANSGDCVIKTTEQAVHVVEIQNRSLLRFKIEITAECESESISYLPNGQKWTKLVEVRGRTDHLHTRRATGDLTCSKTSTDQSISVSVNYETIGCRCFGSTELELLVDTRS